MSKALSNSMSGGTKKVVSLNSAKELIKTQILYQFLNKDDTDLNPIASSIYIEGTMGIGKSMIMVQTIADVSQILNEDMGFVDLRMAGMSGTDIQGIPIPVKEDGQDILVWVKDALLPGIRKSSVKYGILFLDEVNQVEDTSVLSLLYQLLLDKKMNDYSLPEGWVIVSAGNRAEDGGVYNRLPAPIRDRLLILEIGLNKQEWIEWAKTEKTHPAIVSFVDMKYKGKEVLHTYDPDMELDGDEECRNYVFATPRSWISASNEIRKFERGLVIPGTNQLLYSRNTLGLALAGLLGDEIAKAFESFYDNIGELDIEKYINIEWVNSQPMEEIGELSRENLNYLSTFVELNGTIQQKINTIYLLNHSNMNYLVRILENTLTPQENQFYRDYTIQNGNSTLVIKGL